jgi:3-oxoadipate enol-lactonase
MRATINSYGIEYDTHGRRTGLPVVFVHGFPFSKAMWDPQVSALGGDDFYVITYNVRGHGDSDVGDGQYTIEYLVDDLVGLLDHLRLSSAVVVGLSMGGYIALRMVERNPARVRALVLANTRSEADGNEGKIKRAQQAQLVKRDGINAFVEPFLKGAFYERTFQRKPEVVGRIRSIILRTNPLAVAGTLIALAGRTDTTPSLYNIRVPTLILVGQHDTLTPPSASHAMKEKIPGSELHVLSDAAHLSNLENAEEFNRHLQAFLGRLAK